MHTKDCPPAQGMVLVIQVTEGAKNNRSFPFRGLLFVRSWVYLLGRVARTCRSKIMNVTCE